MMLTRKIRKQLQRCHRRRSIIDSSQWRKLLSLAHGQHARSVVHKSGSVPCDSLGGSCQESPFQEILPGHAPP